MTRMWLGVPPASLCDQHLLGEHSELHQEVGTLRNHPHGEAVVRGHVDAGQVVLTAIQRRHAKLVPELVSRGFNHDSPLEFAPYDEAPPELASADQHDAAANRDALASRCAECKDRLAVAPHA